MIRATLSEADEFGRAEITAEGITISSKYPLNRLCRALMMIGHTGGIDCYGPTGLRMTAIVEEYGKRRLSEGDAGFTWKSWDEIGLVSVREAVAKVTVKPASSRKAA